MVDEAADLEDDLVLLREPLEQLAERSQRIGEIYDYETKQRTFGLPKVNANEDSTLEAKLAGMQELVHYRIHHAGAYFRFFLTFFFFAAYSGEPMGAACVRVCLCMCRRFCDDLCRTVDCHVRVTLMRMCICTSWLRFPSWWRSLR